MKNKKIVFIGGVKASWYSLKAMCGIRAIPKIVFCYDKSLEHRAGYSSFYDLKRKYKFSIIKTNDINKKENIKKIRKINPDIIFAIGWSQMLKKEILDIPKFGCVGIHPAKLPQGRGRAPIPWTLIKGLKKSAVTMFYLDEREDAGPIIMQREFKIEIKDNAETLYEKVQNIHVELIREAVPKLLKGKIKGRIQNGKKASYWKKRNPEDGRIDWNKSSSEIYNWIRGLTHPYPGAFTFYNGHKVYVWKSRLLKNSINVDVPGKITGKTKDGIIVSAKKGILVLNLVQFEGKKEINPNKIFERGEKFEK